MLRVGRTVCGDVVTLGIPPPGESTRGFSQGATRLDLFRVR